ncbi:hypothetical protein EJB05_21525 [Eragrostis curvula]|uniref:OTU domain-containing protein n=1 Tax=Eragrostis curvula TaxID=38414 RepID=A0A5J9V1C8_9POAL|nr:hypothetical protein EJB05_21525 [Eragrostis curvula]
MASGSGKGQDATQDPVHGPLQESNDATAAAAEAISSPPSLLAEDLHERPGEGGGSLSPDAAAEAEAAAAAAADRKGKKVAAPSSPSSAGSNSPPAAPVDSVSVGGGSSFALAVDNRRKATVSWKEPAVGEIVEVPQEPKRIDLKGLFDTMVQEQKAIEDTEGQSPEAEEQEMWQMKSPILWHQKKNSPWSKLKCGLTNMVLQRIGRHIRHSNQNSTRPHVDEWVIPMTGNGMIEHYGLLEKVVGEGVKMNSNALLLSRSYSGFRPVLGDGECFYRSFIFSYLEQILDREDKNEEYRLLAAVKEVARQHKRLGWTSEFSNRRKAFKKMVKKVMRWKRYSRWKHVPTTKSYRKQKLLDFFSGSDVTRDIFAFLRLVAAIWICSHWEEYEPRVAELREDYTLRDWCFQEVIPEKVYTDHIQMTALVTALGVPLRVENLFQGDGQDLYAVQDPQDNMPRSTCWPRRHHLPSDHVVPRVTVLFTNGHYDIIYPIHRYGSLPSIDESSSGTVLGESSTATSQSSSR